MTWHNHCCYFPAPGVAKPSSHNANRNPGSTNHKIVCRGRAVPAVSICKGGTQKRPNESTNREETDSDVPQKAEQVSIDVDLGSLVIGDVVEVLNEL